MDKGNANEERPLVFVSYAREDNKADGTRKGWLDWLLLHIKRPLEQAGIDLFIDNFVLTGEYEQKIKIALNKTTAAVLFISPHFMASDYIMDKELPVLISRYKAQQLDLFPLYLSPCTWHIVRIPYPDPGNNSKKAYFLLSGLSCPDHDPKNPLDRESDSKVNEVFSRITQRLLTYHEERKKKMQVGQKSGDKEQERAKLVGVIKRENKSINNKNQPEEKSVHKENRIFQSTTIVPEEQTSKNATIVSDNLQNEGTTIVYTNTTLKEPLPIEAATIAVKINGSNKVTPTKLRQLSRKNPPGLHLPEATNTAFLPTSR